MAKLDDIKKAILEVAGNPTTGFVADNAHAMAVAVAKLDGYQPDARDGDGDGKVQDGTKFERPAKEGRVTEAKETR